MTDLILFISILVGMAIVGDITERILTHKTNKERMITIEEVEDDMDYVELNGELIPYNEEDQE